MQQLVSTFLVGHEARMVLGTAGRAAGSVLVGCIHSSFVGLESAVLFAQQRVWGEQQESREW
jgi:hypothetical protein